MPTAALIGELHTPNQQLTTSGSPFTLFHTALSTNASAFGAVSAKADILRTTNEQPATVLASGIFVLPRKLGSLLQTKFLLTGNDNGLAQVRVWLWHSVNSPLAANEINSTNPEQWTPHLLGTADIQASAKVGIAGGLVDASTRYADTITITLDRSLGPTFMRVMGPATADDGSVMLVIDPGNAQLVEFEVRLNGGSSTAIGGMYNWMPPA